MRLKLNLMGSLNNIQRHLETLFLIDQVLVYTHKEDPNSDLMIKFHEVESYFKKLRAQIITNPNLMLC
jgi:hypothetical protein